MVALVTYGPPPIVWTLDEIRARSLATSSGCWLWTRARRTDGYGHINRRGKHYAAHRVAYEAAHGAIPAGRDIDHLCSVRLCVNPEHLEAVTRAENNRRMWARGERRR